MRSFEEIGRTQLKLKPKNVDRPGFDSSYDSSFTQVEASSQDMEKVSYSHKKKKFNESAEASPIPIKIRNSMNSIDFKLSEEEKQKSNLSYSGSQLSNGLGEGSLYTYKKQVMVIAADTLFTPSRSVSNKIFVYNESLNDDISDIDKRHVRVSLSPN